MTIGIYPVKVMDVAMSQCVQGLPENQLVYMEFSDYRLPHVYFNRGILLK